MMVIDTASMSLSPFKPHWDLYPKTYIAHKTSFPLIDHLDGDLNKDVWSNVPWSDIFDDIRGEADAPDDERPDSNCRTRFKALWGDTHLYIGAILESDIETKARFTERNSPIYQKDSDFEVFIDPFGSCHYYKELEVNAINTIWNLMLDRPYGDGGTEHSGRIAKKGEKQFYEVYHQKTATRVLKGKLNDPSEGATWSVELALSYKDIMSHVSNDAGRPGVGSIWRINFSRVEKEGDINWTWCPQIVWDPKKRRFSGFVAMHLPDAWGHLVFGGEVADSGSQIIPRDPSWPARLAAMNVYYAQKVFHEEHENYSTNIEELSGLLDSEIVSPFNIKLESTDTADFFLATVLGNLDGSVVTVSQDRYLRVENHHHEIQ